MPRRTTAWGASSTSGRVAGLSKRRPKRATSVFVRRADRDPGGPACVHYRALHGKRVEKFARLRPLRIDDSRRDTHRDGIRPIHTGYFVGLGGPPGAERPLPLGRPRQQGQPVEVTSPSEDVLLRRWARLVGETDPEEKARLYLADVLGLDDVTVHDPAACAVAVAGHSAFTERFADELLTREVGYRGWARDVVFLPGGSDGQAGSARQPSMGSLRYWMCRRPRRMRWTRC